MDTTEFETLFWTAGEIESDEIMTEGDEWVDRYRKARHR